MFEDVKAEVAKANRILAELGLSTGAVAGHGHVSMRVPGSPDRFVVKGRGFGIDVLSRAEPEGMIVCDLEGFTLEGPPGATPCFEVKMHSCIYKAHPNVQTIAHTHARFCAVMSVLQTPLVPMCQEGIAMVRRPLPVYPHVAPVITDEEGSEVARLLGESRAILLEGHGATTVGTTLEEAVMAMLNLEEQAKMNWYAYCAAGPNHRRIPDENVAELSNLQTVRQQPHFAELMAGEQTRGPGGIWAYASERLM
jgi:ribulose-5-phosphate 4-epimerase/fuculose-1-phosphate aldolase